jgi:hypothetical protein
MSRLRTTAPEQPLRIDDLRPHLGQLNWQLRRLGLSLQVRTSVRGDGVVRAVTIETPGEDTWTVTCDGCGLVYEPGRAAVPTCPTCGVAEA